MTNPEALNVNDQNDNWAFPIILLEESDEGVFLYTPIEKYFNETNKLGLKRSDEVRKRTIVDSTGKARHYRGIRRLGLVWNIVDIICLNPTYKIEYIPDGDAFTISLDDLRDYVVQYADGPRYAGSKARARLLKRRVLEAQSLADIFTAVDKD